MKQGIFTIKTNGALTRDIFKMTLEGDTSAITRPGQFVNIKLDGMYLRRPISVCAMEDGLLTLIYKVVGEGTAVMSEMETGTKLDLLCGLGNGFDVTKANGRALVAGGGVGLPPMFYLSRKLIEAGVEPVVISGFNSKDDIFLADDFKALGVDFKVATVDGSAGVKGFVTSLIPEVGEYSYFYTCGPEPMLKAISDATVTSGQLSFEERMGCGFGACMGCSCETKYGTKRICRDGPVLEKEEVIW